jgi:hypothetical protein
MKKERKKSGDFQYGVHCQQKLTKNNWLSKSYDVLKKGCGIINAQEKNTEFRARV